MTGDSGTRQRLGSGWMVLAVVVAAYALFLLYFRPVDPFEWDEVLFMRAAERFDVAHYSPHAPGYPAYVAAVRVVHLIAADPQLANQLTVIVAALGLLVALAALVRRLDGSVGESAVAMVVLGVTPAFAFNANVGLSDVPGVALGVAAVLALVAAWDRPAWAWLAAAVTALAVGTRPQVLAALLPVGVAVLVRLATKRRWGSLAAAAGTGVAVSAACWVPAVLLTGKTQFFHAVEILRTYVRVEELGYRLPGAPLDEAVEYWLGRPFGSTPAAVAFWLLAAAGSWWWWRAGRRRMVLVVGGAAVSYLVLGAFSMNFTTAVRYAIPALPFLAVLVAGNLRARGAVARVACVALVGFWCVAQSVWGWPVYELRRSPAPVWDSLEWVTQSFEPSRTTVVYHGLFAPHAEWVLGRAGFDIKVARPGVVYDSSLREDGKVVVVYTRPVPATDVVHRRTWRSGRLERLTRARYYACSVAVAARPQGPVFSTDFQVREHDWELWDIGRIYLGAAEEPVVLTVKPLDGPLFVGGTEQRGRRIEPGRSGEVVLLAGQSGEVVVRTPPKRHVHFAPIEAEPLASASSVLSSAFVVPGLVHGRGPGDLGGTWRSDLMLLNPGSTPLPLIATLLPGSASDGRSPTIDFELQPGSVRIDDVLAHPSWGVSHASGALVVRVAGAEPQAAHGGFFVAGRTLDVSADGEGRRSRWVRGIPFEDGLAAGRSGRLRELAHGGGWRESSGVASVCPVPIAVRFRFETREGKGLGSQVLDVPAFAERMVTAPGEGAGVDAVVSIVDGGRPGCLVFPFAVMTQAQPGAVSVLVADPNGR